MFLFFKAPALVFSPVWLEILGNHGSWLNDSGLLGKICLCEGLLIISLLVSSRQVQVGAYRSIMALTNLLANQLLSPLLGL
jgi:hypothetical protein